MTSLRATFGVALLVAAATVAFSGCGGGGGGTGSIAQSTATLGEIRAQGVAGPIWQNVGGIPITPPTTPTGVFVNGAITFDFNGPVDASSIPPPGPATGAINITAQVPVTPPTMPPTFITTPAVGVFQQPEDIPGLPAGNRRRVRFTPTPPTDPSQGCKAGLENNVVYTILIPTQSGPSSPVIKINGQPFASAALANFKVCQCSAAASGTVTSNSCSTPFTDALAGAPFVVSTTPTTNDPPSGPIDPALVANNTIEILISEPLSPGGVNLQNVILRNTANGAQVPGVVTFEQAGTLNPAPPANCAQCSRIRYIASAPLLGSVTYELLFNCGITDFGGNPVQTSSTNQPDSTGQFCTPTTPAPKRLLFSTNPVTFCTKPPIVELFDNPQMLDSRTGAIDWSGTGSVLTTYPIDIIGDGSDGSFSSSSGTTQFDLDQQITVGGTMVSRQGRYNYTSYTVSSGHTLRYHGPWMVHIRSTGGATVNGTINVNAGTTTAPTGGQTWEQGPKQGLVNNGSTTSSLTVIGGTGNGGGGGGGVASAAELMNGGTAIRTMQGGDGLGPTVNGQPSPDSSQATYAGGQGGLSTFFPPQVTGEVGGLGGAGGTAATLGDVGAPRTSVVAGCGLATTTLTLAQPRAVTQFFIMPISSQAAGSGGGGGGDRLNSAGVTPNTDGQGGGGGAGGGGLRISTVQDYTQAATGILQTNGGAGALGASLSGNGGSGSGGQIWIQSFQHVTLNMSSSMQVIGADRVGAGVSSGCSNNASGKGGQGLIQLEAAVGTPITNIATSSGAVIGTAAFPFTNGVSGEVVSKFYDTNYGAPVFTSVTESTTAGNVTGTALTITYEGAFENLTGGGADLSSLKTTIGGAPGGAKIMAANIAELTGFRFVRFRIHTSYPAPPTSPAPSPSNVYPSVQDITFNFQTGICP